MAITHPLPALALQALKEKVEELKKSSMKIGEAMYKNMDGAEGGSDAGASGGDQNADYKENKDEKK